MHGEAVASAQIARHADNIAAVRVRFAAVKDASAAIAGDDGTYGLLCEWVTENFHDKHLRQDELFAFVDENLRLIGDGLRRSANVAAREPALDRPRLVEPVTVQGVTLAGWTMEHAEPLRDVLDRFTGKPDVITAHAATWYNIAVELRSMGDDLEVFVEYDIADWHGDEAAEHRRLMGHNVDAIKGLSAVSAALAEITESVGVLVAQTRRIVRDLVNDLVALALPEAEQVGTFARWAYRIAVYAVALDTTLTHLESRLNG